MTHYPNIKQPPLGSTDDPRVVTVRQYMDGWVPNAYRWRATGDVIIWTRAGDGWTARLHTYDRKRSHGVGPTWVAFSARDGRLASG